jgi:hypothetical protein
LGASICSFRNQEFKRGALAASQRFIFVKPTPETGDGTVKIHVEEAEAIALKALTFVAEDDARLRAFLGAAGLSLVDLLSRASDPLLLGGVMDFLMQSDSLVCDFAAAAGLKPEDVVAARRALPGGNDGDR